jgi:hypothetical protein
MICDLSSGVRGEGPACIHGVHYDSRLIRSVDGSRSRLLSYLIYPKALFFVITDSHAPVLDH